MTTVARPSGIGAIDILEREFSDAATPLHAMIEIADRCNEVCVHCYQVQGRKGEMTTAEVKSVMDELAGLGVLFLTLSGGEPTLRSDFVELVEHARSLRFAVRIFTNGLTMSPELARRLGELAVQWVEVSLYSSRPEVHDWITRVPGSWEKTTRAVRLLRAESVAVIVKAPMTRLTADDFADWVDLVTSLGADYKVDTHLDAREDGDRTPQALALTEDQRHRLWQDPRLGHEGGTPTPRSNDVGVCGACTGTIHIEPNGEVRPCTQLAVPLGNALTDGVRAAWLEGESARAIRSLTWAELHGCRECDLRHYCSRCFAQAQAEVGDALAPYPEACARARATYRHYHGEPPRFVGRPGGGDAAPMGPYRHLQGGEFEAFEDVLTETDRELAARHGWLRRTPSAEQGAPPVIRPGELVQIRRPGRKPREERIPIPSPGPEHDPAR